MAKKWQPSLKQLSLYDEMLARQNKTRKLLLKRRRKMEQETSFGRGLPDLVLPKKQRRYRDLFRYSTRFNSYEEYRNQIRALQMLYGKGSERPDYAFYKETYRKNILNLIKGWIGDYLNFKEKPTDYFGRYSDEQMQRIAIMVDEGDKYLDLYNKLISLSLGEFMAMYDSNYIPKLQFIYDELKGTGSNMQFSYVAEFIDNYYDYRRQARTKPNRMVSSMSERLEELESGGRTKEGRFK